MSSQSLNLSLIRARDEAGSGRAKGAGMSPRMAAIMGVFQILWVYYGLLTASQPVIAWNVIAVMINYLSDEYRYFVRRKKVLATM